jgi:hypothetical protein
MSTLSQFSEKERDYHAYQARQNYLRQQRTIQFERDELEQQLNEERKAKEEALAEIERLKALLTKNNLDS